MMRFLAFILAITLVSDIACAEQQADGEPLEECVKVIDNSTMQIGIDLEKGGAITFLSWKNYPKNAVNVHDPGRLIQQSYYAGRSLDRINEGQSQHWSPWTWNPIQGGGVGSWARTTEFRREVHKLYCETLPKLWDMPDEEAAAVMRQWIGIEPDMPNVAVVECELDCQRAETDRWGPAVARSQEIPAFYFTRNFHLLKSYLGDGKWKIGTQKPGPPWGKIEVPLKAMACFSESGQGVGVYSPVANSRWNYGPHRDKMTDDPHGAPCVHIAPLTRVALGVKSSYRYRYWIVTGDEQEIVERLDALIRRYSHEKAIFNK